MRWRPLPAAAGAPATLALLMLGAPATLALLTDETETESWRSTLELGGHQKDEARCAWVAAAGARAMAQLAPGPAEYFHLENALGLELELRQAAAVHCDGRLRGEGCPPLRVVALHVSRASGHSTAAFAELPSCVNNRVPTCHAVLCSFYSSVKKAVIVGLGRTADATRVTRRKRGTTGRSRPSEGAWSEDTCV